MCANTFAIRRARKHGEPVYICLLEGHYVNVTADLFSPFVDLRTDLMFLPFLDASSDVIHCSHVLEHVADYHQGLRELPRPARRRLGADSGADLGRGRDLRGPGITDPQERERVYGQHDHVRKYGRDFLERLRLAGFRVQVVPAESITDLAELRRMGIPPEEEVFLCQRESRP